MPKLCTSAATSLLAILLDDFISFCTFLTSHPLHLCYLLFFFPYLVQLLSFLSPLLLSTTLLLLVLFTVSPYLDEVPMAPPEFLGKTCFVVLNMLKDKLQGNGRIELLEQFALVLLPPVTDASPSCQESAALAMFGEFFDSDPVAEERPAGMLSFENDKENPCLASNVGSGETPSKVFLETSTEHLVPNSATGNQYYMTPKTMQKSGKVLSSEQEVGEQKWQNKMLVLWDECIGEQLTRSRSTTESIQMYGSVRQGKEWKSTLACRLYEERMTYKLCKEREVDEGEDMDLLWEAYEANNASDQADTCKKEKKVKEVEPEEDEDEDEGKVGQFCCLQALRLSTGKMNLGMGKRSLMKISKVLKGVRKFRVGSRSSSDK